MAELVTTCPRCNSQRMTFDVLSDVFTGMEHDWQSRHEVFAKCRECSLPSIFETKLADSKYKRAFMDDQKLAVLKGALYPVFRIGQPVTIRQTASRKPPDYLPDTIKRAFIEGAQSLAAGCYNAAGAMFRACVDITTNKCYLLSMMSM